MSALTENRSAVGERAAVKSSLRYLCHNNVACDEYKTVRVSRDTDTQQKYIASDQIGVRSNFSVFSRLSCITRRNSLFLCVPTCGTIKQTVIYCSQTPQTRRLSSPHTTCVCFLAYNDGRSSVVRAGISRVWLGNGVCVEGGFTRAELGGPFLFLIPATLGPCMCSTFSYHPPATAVPPCCTSADMLLQWWLRSGVLSPDPSIASVRRGPTAGFSMGGRLQSMSSHRRCSMIHAVQHALIAVA